MRCGAFKMKLGLGRELESTGQDILAGDLFLGRIYSHPFPPLPTQVIRPGGSAEGRAGRSGALPANLAAFSALLHFLKTQSYSQFQASGLELPRVPASPVGLGLVLTSSLHFTGKENIRN